MIRLTINEIHDIYFNQIRINYSIYTISKLSFFKKGSLTTKNHLIQHLVNIEDL